VLFVNVLTCNVYSQQKNFPIIKFQPKGDTYVYLDSPELKTIKFKVENLSAKNKILWEEMGSKNELFEKIIFTSEEGLVQNGVFVLKKGVDILSLKSFLDEYKIEYFYVNDNKVLTRTLLSASEAQEKATNFKFKNFTSNTEYNDTTKLDYYEFQVYYIESKIYYLWNNDYKKYLLDGTVTRYTDQLDRAIVRRDNFKKHLK
jgi:hypothetical protein